MSMSRDVGSHGDQSPATSRYFALRRQRDKDVCPIHTLSDVSLTLHFISIPKINNVLTDCCTYVRSESKMQY